MNGWKSTDQTASGPIHMTEEEAHKYWNGMREELADRARRLPDEETAIKALREAYERLIELGWRDMTYCPRNGSSFEVVEAGSHAIFPCRYVGQPPAGAWVIEAAGDLYPARPLLFRPSPSTAPGAQE